MRTVAVFATFLLRTSVIEFTTKPEGTFPFIETPAEFPPLTIGGVKLDSILEDHSPSLL